MEIIIPRWGYKRQADTYLRVEWYWRGIVDPENVGGDPAHPPGDNNFCITTVGDDGTKYGFIDLVFGTTSPTHSADGVLLHEFTWQADGTFIIAWGDTGTTQLTDVDQILIEGSNGEHIAIWNGTYYTFNDVDMATSLIADAPSEVCMGMLILPSLFIHYDFNMLLRGA